MGRPRSPARGRFRAHVLAFPSTLPDALQKVLAFLSAFTPDAIPFSGRSVRHPLALFQYARSPSFHATRSPFPDIPLPDALPDACSPFLCVDRVCDPPKSHAHLGSLRYNNLDAAAKRALTDAAERRAAPLALKLD